MRVLVFGDSIAHGMWSVRGGWVQLLRSEFDSLTIRNSIERFPDIYNLGISADNSTNVLARMKREIEVRQRPELAIVVAIGTNDASDSNVHVDLPEYRENLQRIIASTGKFTDKIMFVGLPSVDERLTNPWFVDNSVVYINAALQAYEATLGEVCDSYHIPFVPIFEKFQTDQIKQNLLSDGLHPNDAGHELIANIVRPKLNTLLKN